MRVKLVGDHSALHSGCAAVVDVIKEFYKDHTFVDDESYDVLIVNGEGSMHHSSGGWHRKMIQLKKAVSYGKPCYLVNSVWQDNGDMYDDVLEKVNHIGVREWFSHDELRIMHGVPREKITVAPDLSLWHNLDCDKDVTPYEGVVSTEDYWCTKANKFVKIPGDYKRIDMKLPWPELVKALRGAECLITGRHHAIYAAILAGIPFVAIEGNTWKNSGICYYTQNIKYYNDAKDLDERVQYAIEQKETFMDLNNFLGEYRNGPLPLPKLEI
jgi:hypothetical protein